MEKDQRTHQEIVELRAQLAASRHLVPVGGPPTHQAMISQGISPGVWGHIPTRGTQPVEPQTLGPSRAPNPPFAWSSGTPQPAPIYQMGPGPQTPAGYQPNNQGLNVQQLASVLHTIMNAPPQAQMPQAQMHQAQTPLQAPLTSQGLYGSPYGVAPPTPRTLIPSTPLTPLVYPQGPTQPPTSASSSLRDLALGMSPLFQDSLLTLGPYQTAPGVPAPQR